MTATQRFSGLVLAVCLVSGNPESRGAFQPPTGDRDRQSANPSRPPSPTAGDREDTAVLRFRVLDAATGAVIPARLTFIGDKGPGANLFPNAGAAPNRLAECRVEPDLRGPKPLDATESRHEQLAKELGLFPAGVHKGRHAGIPRL